MSIGSARFGRRTSALRKKRAADQTVREQLRSFVQPSRGDRAIDSGTGAGTLALALALLVREVVGVDIVPELLERARKGAPANVTFVEGDATKLPFETGSFDLACSRRTLHHIAHPEPAIAERPASLRPAGASTSTIRSRRGPLAALISIVRACTRSFAHADPPDVDFRSLLEANDSS